MAIEFKPGDRVLRKGKRGLPILRVMDVKNGKVVCAGLRDRKRETFDPEELERYTPAPPMRPVF